MIGHISTSTRDVIDTVDLIEPVIVAALVNGAETVDVSDRGATIRRERR